MLILGNGPVFQVVGIPQIEDASYSCLNEAHRWVPTKSITWDCEGSLEKMVACCMYVGLNVTNKIIFSMEAIKVANMKNKGMKYHTI